MLTDLLLALSLAIDAFVVSLALGLKRNQLPYGSVVTVPLYFGFCQAAMPWLGWKTGTLFYRNIETYDHWIAFILLLLIGINLIREVKKSDAHSALTISLKSLLLLGVATSIDALAVGFTLPTISTQPFLTIITIGIVTALLCGLAFMGTRLIPKKIASSAEIIAGVVLIGLGCKILITHLF